MGFLQNVIRMYPSAPEILTVSDRFTPRSQVRTTPGPAPLVVNSLGRGSAAMRPAYALPTPQVQSFETFKRTRENPYAELDKATRMTDSRRSVPTLDLNFGKPASRPSVPVVETTEFKNLLEENLRLISENRALKSQVDSLTSQNSSISGLNLKVNELLWENSKLKKEMDALREENRGLQRQQNSLEQNRFDENSRKTDFLLSEVDRLRSEMNRQTQSYNQFAGEYNKLKFEAFDRNNEMKKLSNMVNYLNDQCSQLSRINSSLRDDVSRKSLVSMSDSLKNNPTEYGLPDLMPGTQTQKPTTRYSLTTPRPASALTDLPDRHIMTKPHMKGAYM